MRQMTLIAVMALAAGWGPASPARAAEPSAYEQLDQDKLARKLGNMSMTELLQALMAESGKGVDGVALLARSKLNQALRTADQDKRDRLLGEVIDLQSRLVAATAKLKDDEGVLRRFRFRLDLVITLGITRVDPYAERLLYFLGTAKDREAVAKCTKEAIGRLNGLQTDLDLKRDDWGGDTDRMVTGGLWRLEALVQEARYRGAWIRFYRGMVLSDESHERRNLLQQAIGDVREFADAEDNSSGVKFTSLGLSGMAARELGLWQQAASYLSRADSAEARPATRLKAKFETVRISIDRKQFDQADKQIQAFVTQGAKLTGVAKVAVDMQASLLRFKTKMERAEQHKKTDPKQYEKLRGQGGQELLAFVEKHPQYREAFWDVIAALFEDADPGSLDPSMQLALGVKEFFKRTDEGYQRAERLFLAVVRSAKATDDLKASALSYLALIRNDQRRNLEAAAFFRELAEKYPKNPKAKESALNAVKSYNGILKEQNVPARKLGMDFLRGYARALKVLAAGWGRDDPEIRAYYFPLGLALEDLGRNKEAVEALKQIPEGSELYMPSRYRILEVNVSSLLDAPNMRPHLRRQLANNLIRDLTAYMGRVRLYASKTANKQRREVVLGWGAECGMLIAQLYKDVLNEPAEAMQRARELAADPSWKQVPGIARRSQQFVVALLLEAGQPEKAVPVLLALMEGDDATGAEKLLAQAVGQIGDRIERLLFSADPADKAKLKELRNAYKLFAEELYKFVDKSANVTDKQKAPFKQALAHAYEFGSEAEARKSLELYQQLNKQNPNDASIIRGLARAYREMGEPKQAMDHYYRLRRCLPGQSPHWWRAELEYWEYALEIHAGSKAELAKIPVQMHILRDTDRDMGGYWKRFNELEARAEALLGSKAPAGATSRRNGF